MFDEGYGHAGYAEALSEFGRPQFLSRSGGWILDRQIPTTCWHDAMGCYPVFACRDWSALGDDVIALGEQFVSLVIVTDPFGDYCEDMLSGIFRDLTKPFKEHFVADVRERPKSFVTKHHQYYARKALAAVDVEVCENAAQHLDEWSSLYGNLVARHHLQGIKAFSRGSFAKQLDLPGMIMLRAISGGQTVGAQLWQVRQDVAYSHLLALNDAGYNHMAAYALAWTALEYFEGTVRWIDWGAGAGADAKGAAGLEYFKRGWANGRRTTYLCGRIFDPKTYHNLSRGKNTGTPYFPLYRAGELA